MSGRNRQLNRKTLKQSRLYNNLGGGKLRQSNIEALRIIAMSMILIHHFLVHGIGEGNIPHNLYYVINPFVYCGVNIFFLITGHFSIRYTFRGLVKFVIGILFFGVVNLMLMLAANGQVSLKSVLNTILFPVSGSPYWFLHVYLLLMASAPLLNAGLRALTRTQIRNIVIVLTALILYMRGGHGNHTYFQALYFYCVGYYMRLADLSSAISKKMLLSLFLLSCSLAACADYASIMIRHQPLGYLTLYNNIFVITGAVSLYLLFCKLCFTSLTINRIASASLGCYLLQDGKFGYSFLYGFQNSFLEAHGFGWALLGMFTACFLLFWTASYILTRFQNIWINPLTDRILSIVHRLLPTASRIRLPQ